MKEEIKSILIVDDSPDQIILVKTILKEYEFNFFEARNCEEALIIYKHQHIDLILSDLEMPGANGLELLQKVRQLSTVKFIIMTGSLSFSSQLAMECGATSVIFKPYGIESLLNILQQFLGPLNERVS